MLFGKRTRENSSHQRDAFEKQAERVFQSVYGTALRLTRSREDAEDLAQEAIVRAYEAYERFDGENFKAWILRIVTNLYINKYRQRQRGPQLSYLEEDAGYEPAAESGEEPDNFLLRDMLGQEVDEALGKVPTDFRMAVVLCDIEGLSYQEIAEATGVPIGTVRSRLARGRTMLRRELQGYAMKEGYLKND